MKKVIFMTYDFPYPFNSGGKIRAYNLLKYAGKGFDITLYSFTRGEIPIRHQKKLQEIGISSIKLFPRPSHNVVTKIRSIPSKDSIFKRLYYSRDVENDLISDIKNNAIDILHCESFYTSFYINEQVLHTGVKAVYGSENIEYKIYRDYVSSAVHKLLRPIYFREVSKIRNEEVAAAQHSSAVIAVTDEEAAFFSKVTGGNVQVVSNGIDLEYFSYRKLHNKENHNILFVGNFKYFPNISAVKFIYESIYSQLDKSKYSLTIVGKGAENLPIPRDRNINFIDYIEDIRDAYYNASVFLFPLTLGGGTNFKVLEAMATGVPIIARNDRIQSLGVATGKHYIAADTGREFIQAIEDITHNQTSATKISAAARSFVEKNYSWQVIGKNLQRVWKNL